jgi:hypothetical protein
VALELVVELGDVARNRDRVRVAERAETFPEDPVAEVEQEVELTLGGSASSIGCKICVTQRVPSRHGTHLPHDSYS